MDIFIWLLFTLIGGAVGAGGTSVFIKNRLQKEKEHEMLERDAEREGHKEQLQDIKDKMNNYREEGKKYYEDLQNETKKLLIAQEEVSTIPDLEKQIAVQKEQLFESKKAQDQLVKDLARSQNELAAEKQSFAESLIFVHGCHYLPGYVVKDLMASSNKQTNNQEL